MLEHVITERGHCDMLERWMRSHAILGQDGNPRDSTPTLATIAGIAYGYRLVLGDTVDAQIVGLNTAVETCSYDLFSTTTPRLTALGLDSEY